MKLYTKEVQEYDHKTGNSNFRLIETIVERVVDYQYEYSTQFFQDFEIYGIDEAIISLKYYDKNPVMLNHRPFNQEEIKKLKEIIERIRKEINEWKEKTTKI